MAENALSILTPKRHFRVHHMVGDSMSPTFRPGEPLIVVAISKFAGEGYYLFDDGGVMNVYRCSYAGKGMVRFMRDHPTYTSETMSLEWVNENVIGKIAASVKVLDSLLMEGAQ